MEREESSISSMGKVTTSGYSISTCANEYESGKKRVLPPISLSFTRGRPEPFYGPDKRAGVIVSFPSQVLYMSQVMKRGSTMEEYMEEYMFTWTMEAGSAKRDFQT